MIPDIVEIKCDGCGTMRKWQGYECLTLCDCLVDTHEEEELEEHLIEQGAEMKQVNIPALVARIVNTNNYENLSKDIHTAIKELTRCDMELDILHNLITEKYEACMPEIKTALNKIEKLDYDKAFEKVSDYIDNNPNFMEQK